MTNATALNKAHTIIKAAKEAVEEIPGTVSVTIKTPWLAACIAKLILTTEREAYNEAIDDVVAVCNRTGDESLEFRFQEMKKT